MDFSEQRKAPIVSPGRSQANGELSEVDSGQGGTARVHGVGVWYDTAADCSFREKRSGVLALMGSSGMLVAQMLPKRQASCNVCVPGRPHSDTLRWDCVSACIPLALGAGCFSSQCFSALVMMSSG